MSCFKKNTVTLRSVTSYNEKSPFKRGIYPHQKLLLDKAYSGSFFT